jgi:purine-binding chemotaxis protein CheW
MGNLLLGIPVSHILEIVASVCPQPVPLSPKFVGGIVHYRGDVLTTVSLREILCMPPSDRPQPVLVLESPGGLYGLLVDAVGQVMTVSPQDYEPNPSTLGEKQKAIFMGTYKLADGLLVVLDPVRLEPLELAAAESA